MVYCCFWKLVDLIGQLSQRDLIDQSDQPEYNTINWHDTTHFDPEDD